MSAATVLPPHKQSIGFNRILIATDFSQTSRRAVPYALALARQYKAEVHFAHALPTRLHEPIPLEPLPRELDRQRFEAERHMKHLLETLVLGNLRVHPRIEEGAISEVLSSVIREQDIDLLVFSTHGRGGLRKLVMGSVAEEMLRQMSCPVLTLGKKAALEAGIPSFERILFATDFGPGAMSAVPVVLGLAEKYRSALTLLHMLQPKPIHEIRSAAHATPANLANEFVTWEVNQKDETLRQLKQLMPPETQLAHNPNYVVASAPAAEGILRAAAEQNVGLIVMGANHGASPRAAAHIPWAVVHQVICEARCPVLTVKG